jgi:hypothetical protein
MGHIGSDVTCRADGGDATTDAEVESEQNCSRRLLPDLPRVCCIFIPLGNKNARASNHALARVSPLPSPFQRVDRAIPNNAEPSVLAGKAFSRGALDHSPTSLR